MRLNLKELETRVHPIHDGGLCHHPLIGTFAYQNFHLAQVMLTAVWRSEASCHGFTFPKNSNYFCAIVCYSSSKLDVY